MNIRNALAATCLAVSLVVPGTAFAAGNGYGPGNGPTTTQPGYGFTSVVTVQVVTAHAATLRATYHFASIVIQVPENAFSKPAQIEVTTPTAAAMQTIVPKNFHMVMAFGFGFTGPYPAKPLTVPIYNSRIPKNAMVYNLVGKKLTRTQFSAKLGRVSISLSNAASLIVLVPVA